MRGRLGAMTARLEELKQGVLTCTSLPSSLASTDWQRRLNCIQLLCFGEVGHANAALIPLFCGQKLPPKGMGWEMENATKAAMNNSRTCKNNYLAQKSITK